MSNRINYNSIPQNGLVLDMPLDGNANARVGTNGTATNVTWVDSEKGYTSKVGSFNGSSSVNFTSIGGLTTLTLSCYIKLNSDVIGAGLSAIYSDELGGAGNAMGLTIHGSNYHGNNNEIGFYIYGTNNGNAWSNMSLVVGQQYHIVGIYDGTTSYIYIDGVLKGTFTVSGGFTTIAHSSFLGKNSVANDRYFNGTIGLVKIYNRALSTEEIHNLKLEGDRLFGDQPNYPQLLRGLKAYYDFKGGSLSNLVDGTNATNNGATLTTDHLGRPNNAYSFNGVNQNIDTLYNPYTSLGANPTFSINIIFKYKSGNTVNDRIFGNYNNVSQIVGLIYDGGTGVQLATRDSNGIIYITLINNTWIDNVYYNVTLIRKPGIQYICVNGIVTNTITDTGTGNFDSGRNIFLGSTPTLVNYSLCDISLFTFYPNIALNSSEVKELYNLTSKEYIYPFSKSSLLALQKGLVMHLDSNGVDLSGNGNNGTPTAVTPTRRGQSEGGVYNGSSSYVGPITNPGITTNVTLSAIVSSTDINNAQCIIGNFDQAVATGTPSINIVGGIIYFGKSYVSNDVTYTFSGINNKSYLITCTYDGVTGKIYIDGQLVAQANYTLTYNSACQFAIGRQGTGYYFNGNIYSPKIRNRALSPKEVEMEYYLNYIN